MMRLVFVMAACCAAGGAQAAVATYTSLAGFSLAAGPTQLEDFNALTNQDYAEGTSHGFTGFSMSYVQGAGSSNMGVGIRNGSSLGSADIDGTQSLAFGEDVITDGSGSNGPVITLTFPMPIFALGFDWGDGDSTDSYKVEVAGTSHTAPPFANSSPNSGTGFFGVISDTPFSTAVFSSAQTGGFLGPMALDNIRTGVNVVPVPAALPLMLGGLGLLAGLGRRRRH